MDGYSKFNGERVDIDKHINHFNPSEHFLAYQTATGNKHAHTIVAV